GVEVVVQAAGQDPGGVGDLAHGRGAVPLLCEKVRCDRDHVGPAPRPQRPVDGRRARAVELSLALPGGSHDAIIAGPGPPSLTLARFGWTSVAAGSSTTSRNVPLPLAGQTETCSTIACIASHRVWGFLGDDQCTCSVAISTRPGLQDRHHRARRAGPWRSTGGDAGLRALPLRRARAVR